MEPVITQLKSLGLSDKEARCYAALVELGEASAYRVAQRAKLKRPIVYVVLDELRQKGLALKVPHAKKQLFLAKDPADFFAQYEETLRYAKRALPELLAAADKRGNRARTLYFEGKEGIREALWHRLGELKGKELRVLYSKGKKPISQMYFDYNQALYDQGSHLRGFMPDHHSLDEFVVLDKKYGWDIRKLPLSEYSPEASVEIAEGFVRILLHKDAQAVIVENKLFADMMRQTFEMLWKHKAN